MSDRGRTSSRGPVGFEGEFTSGSLFDRAVRVAGALAEQGVQAVAIVRRGQRRSWPSRTTDLPGKLADSVDGENPITLETPIATFEITSSKFRWSTANSRLAQTLCTLA